MWSFSVSTINEKETGNADAISDLTTRVDDNEDGVSDLKSNGKLGFQYSCL